MVRLSGLEGMPEGTGDCVRDVAWPHAVKHVIEVASDEVGDVAEDQPRRLVHLREAEACIDQVDAERRLVEQYCQVRVRRLLAGFAESVCCCVSPGVVRHRDQFAPVLAHYVSRRESPLGAVSPALELTRIARRAARSETKGAATARGRVVVNPPLGPGN